MSEVTVGAVRLDGGRVGEKLTLENLDRSKVGCAVDLRENRAWEGKSGVVGRGSHDRDDDEGERGDGGLMKEQSRWAAL